MWYVRKLRLLARVLCYSLCLSAVQLYADNTSNTQLITTESEWDRFYISKAVEFAKLGQAAGQAGHWHQARDNWRQAVEYVELAKVADRNRAVFYYEYGHAAGISCEFELADEFIEKSYQLDKAIDGPYILSLVELFRLYYDQGQYSMASVYLDATLPSLLALNAANNTPELFYELLMQYSQTLKIIGKQHQSFKIRQIANKIHLDSQYIATQTPRILYGSHCNTPSMKLSKTASQAAFINIRISKIRKILNALAESRSDSK